MKMTKSRNIVFSFLIVVFALSIRLFYQTEFPNLLVSSDTFGYYETGRHFYNMEKFIDDTRTPVYPLILAFPAFIQGRTDTPVLSPLFLSDMKYIVWLQAAISIASLIVVYGILKKLGIKSSHAFLFTVFIVFNISHFATDRLLLTESFGAGFVVTIVWLSVSLFKKFSAGKIYILTLVCILAFLLKPVFAFLFIFPVFYMNILHKNRKTAVHSLLSLSILLIILFSYIGLNKKLNGYNGISRVSDYNLLGVILVRDLDVSAARDNPLYEKLIEYRKMNGEKMPFRFLDFVDPVYYQRKPVINRIKSFNGNVLKNNLPKYISKSLIALPGAMLAKNDSYPVVAGKSALSVFFKALYMAYNFLLIPTLIVLPGAVVMFFKFLKKPDFRNASWAMIAAVCLYQVIFSVFFSYGEYGRLIYPTQTFTFLFTFFCWYGVYRTLAHQ